jgi:hypothetical protein
MGTCSARVVDESAASFYAGALARLDEAAIPYLIGGAFAFIKLTNIERDTKDLDLFVRPADCPRVLELFDAIGYRTEMPFPHWLGKVHCGPHFMDVIYSSGNGIARVDDLWFTHACTARLFDRTVRLCPAEEMVWSKSFVQERERFDGADVMHIIRELGPALDWDRLLMRFADHWRVLLAHLVTFGFVYPAQRQQIPDWVLAELTRRLAAEPGDAKSRTCRGTLLSREQYLVDIERFGYRDARLEPEGPMTQEEVQVWTAAIGAPDDDAG